MSTKYDLVDLYVDEAKTYRTYKELGLSRTTTGNLTFTSSSSSTTYSSTTGQLGIMQSLETLLITYKINATDWNGIETNIAIVQTQINTHLADYTLQIPYGGVTTGTVNTYALAAPIIATLTTGMAVSVKFNIDSTGASTLNWNSKGAKGIKKANGTDVTNLKATGIYTLRYDGTNFILQGEGASGNAIASDLLSGKTAGSDVGDIIGTMPIRNGASVGTLYPAAGHLDVVPLNGYYDGTTGSYVTLIDANFIAANIPNGMSMFGLTGTSKRYATGTLTTGTGVWSITGLAFNPTSFYYYLITQAATYYSMIGGGTNLADMLYGGNVYKQMAHGNTSGSELGTANNTVVFGVGQITNIMNLNAYALNIRWVALE